MGFAQVVEWIARLADKGYDRMRDKRAFAVTEEAAVSGDFTSLKGHKYALLVTYRRSGEAVPSPVWFALDDRGRAFIRSAGDAFKVKRVRNDGRVLFAAANVRGKPVGPVIKGTARILPEEEWAHAEAALAAAYGGGRKVYERFATMAGDHGAYIEVVPGR